MGITTRRALDSRVGTPFSTLLGAFAALALVGVVGFLALNSGLLPGGDDDASSTPRGAAVSAVPSLGSSGPFGSVRPTASIGTSPDPGAVPSASALPPEPSNGGPSVPPASSSPPPSVPPVATGFTCEPVSVSDTASAAWRIVGARWVPRNGFDQLALVLQRRRTDAAPMGIVTVESMPTGEVTERYGLPAPGSGDRAVVLSFEGPFLLPAEIDGNPNLTSIQEVSVVNDGGTVRAIVGVAGEGCHRLGVAGWAFQSAPQEVEAILDVRHE